MVVQCSQEDGFPLADLEFLQGQTDEGFFNPVPGPFAIGQKNLPRLEPNSCRSEGLADGWGTDGQLSAAVPELQDLGSGALHRIV
jgi:hypothetical protein